MVSFRDLVAGDMTRQTDAPFGWLRAIALLRRPSFASVFFHRIAHCCVSKGMIGKAMSLFFYNLAYTCYACDISVYATIGPGFVLSHPTGVVIGHSTLGKNVTIMQNVSVGVRKVCVGLKVASDEAGTDFSDVPVFGDDVLVYPGAVIAGRIKLGNRAIVGANSVVLKDVPADATAVGIPARIIEKT